MYFYLEQTPVWDKDAGKPVPAEKFNSHGEVKPDMDLESFAFTQARGLQRVFTVEKYLDGEGFGKGVTLKELKKAKATKVVGVSKGVRTRGQVLDI